MKDLMTSRPSAAARFALVIGLAVTATGISGCGRYIADMPLVGLPADAPPRKQAGSFMPVHDLPPERDSVKIETAEEARIRAELASARDRQNAAAAAATK